MQGWSGTRPLVDHLAFDRSHRNALILDHAPLSIAIDHDDVWSGLGRDCAFKAANLIDHQVGKVSVLYHGKIPVVAVAGLHGVDSDSQESAVVATAPT